MVNLITFDDFCGGAVKEKLNIAMKEVIDNMLDPNTPWKKNREVNVKFVFQQNEDRDDLSATVQVTTKTAPVSGVETRMCIGKDIRTGQVYAHEYGKQVKGQLSFEDLPAVDTEKVIVGEDVVDTETGEVTGRVVDFRAQEA